jgi:hypothetical protein
LRTSRTKYESTTTKIREPQSPTPLSQEVIEKLKQRGIDSENVTLAQLFPETLDTDGNDLSLMSGAEWEIMITYAKTRKYLLEKYPQSQEEAKMLGQSWEEEPEEPYQINIPKTQDDPQKKVFVKALTESPRRHLPQNSPFLNTKLSFSSFSF